MNVNSAVLASIPRAGVGNRLLVWAHAAVFAARQNLPLYENGWATFNLGPYLRGERTKRNYYGVISKGQKLPGNVSWPNRIIVPESDWNEISTEDNTLYVSSDMPHYEKLFDLIIDHRHDIVKYLQLKIQIDDSILESYEPPDLALHIRLGDFTKFPWYKTRWDYYRKLLIEFSERFSERFRVHIFSDGYQKDIPLFKEFSNLEFISLGNDILDMLALSRASIIHTYPGSTFGMWAAFISDSVILHSNDLRLRNGQSRSVEKEYRTYDNEGLLSPEFKYFLREYNK